VAFQVRGVREVVEYRRRGQYKKRVVLPLVRGKASCKIKTNEKDFPVLTFEKQVKR